MYYLYVVGIVTSFLSMFLMQIPMHIILYLLSLFNIRHYEIDNNEFVTEFKNNFSGYYSNIIMTRRCMKTLPGGYFINKRCIGHINKSDNNESVHVLCHSSFIEEIFNKIMKQKDIDNDNDSDSDSDIDENIDSNDVDNINSNKNRTTKNKKKTLTCVYNIGSSYDDKEYASVKITPRAQKPLIEQKNIINSILSLYKERNTLSVFISGSPGSGKTSVGGFVAMELNALYTYMYDPTEPGSNIYHFYRDYQHGYFDPNNFYGGAMFSTTERHLIILIDEIDVIISKIHTGIEKHERLSCDIYNKQSYNNYMDHIYDLKNVIFIFTSNHTREYIDETYDPSYLREGRIDAYFTLDKPIISEIFKKNNI